MTLAQAKDAGAKTLVIGVANRGGVIADSWIEVLSAALAQGYDLAAGLHNKLADIPQLSDLAAQNGQTLFDVRHPTDTFDVGSGERRSGQRVLAVGTDCSCGKMYTTLAMEIVRRSFLGFCLAHLSRPLGAPVPPFAGKNVPTIVRLYETPAKDGIVWERRYAFSNNRATTIKSIKLYTDTEGLLEWVGGGLGMYLDVFEQDQKLHFVSQSYFWRKGPITIPLPAWLSPGRTHVIHTDEGNGWFRFTMEFHDL